MKPRPVTTRARTGASPRLVLLSLAGPLAAALLLGAVPSRAATGSRLLLGLGVSTWYDDNTLQYSTDQIVLLDSGTRPERFSVESSDDPALSPSVSLALNDRLGKGRTRTIRLRGQGEFHQNSRTADFRSGSILWQEPVSRGSRLSLSGYYTPHFYLRQLRDDDITAVGVNPYRRAEFSLAIAALRWKQRVGRRTALETSYQFEHRGYNADFVERTSNTHEGKLAWGWSRLGGRGSASVHGGYRASDARGADGDETPGSLPDDPDVGYHGILAGVDGLIDLEPHRAHGFTLGLGYELATRDYTSKVASDTYHAGRKDVDHTIDASLRWSARGGLAVRGFYRHETNDARLGTAAPAASDVGSFTENQVGIAVEWSKVLWRSTAGGDDSDDDTP